MSRLKRVVWGRRDGQGQWQEVPTGERRAHWRYRMAIPVEYVVGDQRGLTTTSDLSSHAVFINLDRRLAVGEPVRLLLDWPAMLNENAALRLEIKGGVLRSDDNGAAISVCSYEFRVRSRPRLEHA